MHYNYLMERGFTREIIDTQKIGWALPQLGRTCNLTSAKRIHYCKIWRTCGLIIQKESDNKYFDRFRGRIMFPIRDENGKVIAFSGRILNSDARMRQNI